MTETFDRLIAAHTTPVARRIVRELNPSAAKTFDRYVDERFIVSRLDVSPPTAEIAAALMRKRGIGRSTAYDRIREAVARRASGR